MTHTDDGPAFRRSDLLAGASARRSTTLLFAIEGRTAQLVDRSRTAMATYLTPQAQRDRERAFLDALSSGRQPRQITAAHLERHADDWATLVPPDPTTQAALAGLMGDKYAFRLRDAPGIRRALRADDPQVAVAFERLRGRPLNSIYAETIPLRERLRWRRSKTAGKLEDLPPAWMAFALTLTETVGAGILALPIAFAAVGARAAVLLLVVFGLVNVLTIAALVEAITRDGRMRYGTAYFGTFVGQYLGRPGSTVVSIAMLLLNGIGLVALMIGFGSALEGVSGLPAGAWAALLAAAVLLTLRRESLDATVASALVIGAVNIALLMVIAGIAFADADAGSLTSARVPKDGSVAGLIFGTALMAYFGHTSAGNAAKVVLRRDPGGRALMRGNVGALMVAMALYALIVIAILGAVPASVLAGYDGTALTPLIAVTGPTVAVLGAVFVVLAMGLSSLHCALGLYNQVGEWLPRQGSVGAPGGRTSSARTRLATSLQSARARAVVKALPVVALLVGLEILLLTGTASFTGSISFLGTVTIPLLGGLFPMLLLAASRRRGEYVPSGFRAATGHPVVVGTVCAVFLAGLLAHALVIWEHPYERASALASSAAFVVVLGWSWRRRAFAPQTVVEVRLDCGPPDRLSITVVSSGTVVHTPVLSRMLDGTERVNGAGLVGLADQILSTTVDLPADTSALVRVWSHRVDATGDSVAWSNAITIEHDGRVQPIDLDRDGRATVTATAGAHLVI